MSHPSEMPSRPLDIWQSLESEREVWIRDRNLDIINISVTLKSKYHMVFGI